MTYWLWNESTDAPVQVETKPLDGCQYLSHDKGQTAANTTPRLVLAQL